MLPTHLVTASELRVSRFASVSTRTSTRSVASWKAMKRAGFNADDDLAF